MRYDVEQIRATLDIAEIATSAGVRLRGGRGPCPLCNTSSASTSFSIRNKRFRCFACGEHGDVIELLAKLSGSTWLETVPVAAKMAGVEPGARVVVKVRREDPRIFISQSFRQVVALRDRLAEIVADETLQPSVRATALAAAMECEDTLDFIMEEDPCR